MREILSKASALFSESKEFRRMKRLLRFASSPKSDYFMLRELVCIGDFEIQRAVINNPAADSRILGMLAEDPKTNPLLLVEMLKKIDLVPSWIIRAVVENPSTPREMMIEVVQRCRSREAVLVAVAKCRLLTEDAARELLLTRNDDILNRLAFNPATPADVLIGMVDSDEIEVRVLLPLNPNCPNELVEALLLDSSYRVQLNLISRGQLSPAELRFMLLSSADPAVLSDLTAALHGDEHIPFARWF